jgi:hypothetical protein
LIGLQLPRDAAKHFSSHDDDGGPYMCVLRQY